MLSQETCLLDGTYDHEELIVPNGKAEFAFILCAYFLSGIGFFLCS